jgi:NADH dehydrogenase
LPAFPESLADRAKRDLENLGVQVRTATTVTHIDETGVTLDGGEKIRSCTVIWGAGNAASPVMRDLKAQTDKAGRVQVEGDLSVPGRPEVFVVGDGAFAKQTTGKPVPGVAQGAIQGGRHAARNVLRRIHGEPTKPFSYFNKGDLAVIGRNKAIANIMGWKVAGFIAWAIWLFIHILYLVGFRNRLQVLIQWAWSYLTFERGARIIMPVEQRELGQTATGPGQHGIDKQAQPATVGSWPK